MGPKPRQSQGINQREQLRESFGNQHRQCHMAVQILAVKQRKQPRIAPRCLTPTTRRMLLSFNNTRNMNKCFYKSVIKNTLTCMYNKIPGPGMKICVGKIRIFYDYSFIQRLFNKFMIYSSRILSGQWGHNCV